MKLFLDTANLNEIKAAAQVGLIDGVTTNPSLLAKEKLPIKETIIEICGLVNGPISAEVIDISSTESIVTEGEAIAKWHANVIVKIPCTLAGIAAVRILEAKGIRTNVTLVFSPNQVLLAAKANASFISPFVGRLDDVGENGMHMIATSLEIIQKYGFKSQIIVASVRSPLTVVQASQLGAHIATVPYKILEQMIKHPLTDLGIKKFEEDWKNAQQ